MLDLDKRSKVINLCPWGVSFTLPNSGAELILDGNKTTTIHNAELVSLADNQNVMFWGTNYGDHARIYVDNAEYRKHVGFDDDENKKTQLVLTDEVMNKIIELKSDTAFKKNVTDKVIMPHEKAIFIEYCRKVKFNDHNKINFIEEYTGEKF
jgi:tRNA G10  N-methylase Trm11